MTFSNAYRGMLALGFLSSLSSRAFVSAATNVTVDDSDNTITYSPSGVWHQGNDCTGCRIQPDLSLTFDGTWHDSTTNLGDSRPFTIQVPFTGTAVYAYFIVSNRQADPGVVTLVNASFAIDGQEAGEFVHVPLSGPGIDYGVNAFAIHNLENEQHSILITANNQVNSSNLIFDYLVYTREDTGVTGPSGTSTSSSTSASASPTQSNKSTTHSGIIAGGVVGGTVGLSLIAFTLFLCLRRNNRHATEVESVGSGKEELDYDRHGGTPVAIRSPALARSTRHDPYVVHPYILSGDVSSGNLPDRSRTFVGQSSESSRNVPSTPSTSIFDNATALQPQPRKLRSGPTNGDTSPRFAVASGRLSSSDQATHEHIDSLYDEIRRLRRQIPEDNSESSASEEAPPSYDTEILLRERSR